MKITATENIRVKGEHVGSGDTVETDPQTARHLIASNLATVADEKPAAPKKKRPRKPAPPAEDPPAAGDE